MVEFGINSIQMHYVVVNERKLIMTYTKNLIKLTFSKKFKFLNFKIKNEETTTTSVLVS